MSLLGLLRGHATFGHGGVHPLGHKDETAAMPIRRMPFAPRLVIHLSQHKGVPAAPIVKVGQEVVRGEPIAVADGHVSVPMHSPATGRIAAIDLWPTADGPKASAIIIDVYVGDTQEVLYEDPVDIMNLAPSEIVEMVKDAGLVGLGGAAFPSHVKMLPPPEKPIHTVVVNGCECEPYLTCDHRVMLEHTDALIRGIRIAMRATGARRALVGVEDNKMDAVVAIRHKLQAEDPIEVHAVRAKYPQGAEKMLIESLLDQQIPEGGLPVDLGVAVYNVGTLAQMGDLLPRGRGLIERVVTVSGAGVRRPGNYLVPIGTPVGFLLQQAGMDADANKIILGGPMMGMTVSSLDVPVCKGVSGVVVYEAADPDQRDRKVYPCIKCAHCVEACPMRLNPSMMAQLAHKREYERMETEFHLKQCFECGCCAYVCPSNIPLTQYFRIAKAINRERPVLDS